MLTCNHFNIDLGGEGERGREKGLEVVLRVWAIALVWDCSHWHLYVVLFQAAGK